MPPYVGNNELPAAQISEVIGAVHKSLSGLQGGAGESQAAPSKPAVPIRRSVTPDYIVCLEDGKKLKMLKRHIRTTYNLTPDEYRAKWGLASDYPMVAPNYAKPALRIRQEDRVGPQAGRDQAPRPRQEDGGPVLIGRTAGSISPPRGAAVGPGGRVTCLTAKKANAGTKKRPGGNTAGPCRRFRPRAAADYIALM